MHHPIAYTVPTRPLRLTQVTDNALARAFLWGNRERRYALVRSGFRCQAPRGDLALRRAETEGRMWQLQAVGGKLPAALRRSTAEPAVGLVGLRLVDLP